jgi:hypothetical protein
MKKTKKTIKIIGYGAVVKHFLNQAAHVFPHLTFEIYARNAESLPSAQNNVRFIALERFLATELDTTFFCCSANEQEILKDPKQEGRIKVADANLAVASLFIAKGFFRRGTIFVLTNPSEIVAEYLFRETTNNRIFALGLSNDYRRYNNIFTKIGFPENITKKFTLSGNHWDHPALILDDNPELHQQLVVYFSKNSNVASQHISEHLHDLLKQEIATEFSGAKPPIQSGALVLHDAVQAISNLGQVLVSGIDIGNRNFVAGMLECLGQNQLIFTPSPFVNSKEVVNQIYEKHRSTFNKLIKEMLPEKTEEQ